ncbi:MAG: prepilin-type N-terminal cleavage/methylation domain-containing protein [Opitutales bacterium]|nr:prepilin-type N-terminal cleavage/methylation domain-containing protein [Opitutales bacterium]
MYQEKQGFSLVEIMIVVVIIGLLAAMAIPAYQRTRTRSMAGVMENDARQIAAAVNQYMMDNGFSTAPQSEIIGIGNILLGDNVTCPTDPFTAGGTFELANGMFTTNGVYRVDTGKVVTHPH